MKEKIFKIARLARERNIFAFAALLAVAIAIYYPVLNNALIGDDLDLSDVVSRVPFPQYWQLFGSLTVFIKPLPLLVLWFQFKLFGLTPFPAHFLNVLLHAGNAFLLFWLLLKLDIKRIYAFAAAMIFVTIPIAPEDVTWVVAGRFDLIALFFMLLTLGLYLEYLKTRNLLTYIAAAAAFAAALLSKEVSMIMIALLPAADFLLVQLTGKEAGTRESIITRVTAIFRRIAPFAVIFAGYIVLRLKIVGHLGGYPNVPLIGKPSLEAVKKTTETLLSPLNSYVFGHRSIILMGSFFAFMYAISLFLVATRWKKAGLQARRAWLLLVSFFILSLMPVFAAAFMIGLDHTLRESRYLYIPTMMLTAFMVLGLLAFGFRHPVWKGFSVMLLVAAFGINAFALVQNNKPWERASEISDYIPEATVSLVPDPPQDAHFFFQIPEWDGGSYIYVNGISQAIKWKYGREDLSVRYLSYRSRKDVDPSSYVFFYDLADGKLKIVDFADVDSIIGVYDH